MTAAYLTRLADTARCLPPEHVELAEDITAALDEIDRLRKVLAEVKSAGDDLYDRAAVLDDFRTAEALDAWEKAADAAATTAPLAQEGPS